MGYENRNKLRWDRGRLLLTGMVMIMLGVIAIAASIPGLKEPQIAVWEGAPFNVLLTIGSVLLAGAITRTIDRFYARRWDKLYLDTLLGLLYILGGIFLLAYQRQGMLAVTLILAIYFALEGVIKISMSLELRTGSEICLFTIGTLSLITGCIFFASLAQIFFWALGLLAGINLILEGCCGVSNGLSAFFDPIVTNPQE